MNAVETVEKFYDKAVTEFQEYLVGRTGKPMTKQEVINYYFSLDQYTEEEDSAWESGYLYAIVRIKDVLANKKDEEESDQ